jgi:hypothetical protein
MGQAQSRIDARIEFGEQEPGSAEEIQTFCSTTYGVSFPMTQRFRPTIDPESDELTAAIEAQLPA